MTSEIRRLTKQDIGVWRDLRLEALQLHPENFLTTYDEELARSDADRLAMLERRLIFGAFSDGVPAGTAALDPQTAPAEAHRGSLNAFYLRGAFRGSGLAQALLTHVVEGARTLGLVQLELCVAQENTRAIAFYHRNGFQEWGRLPRSVRLPDRYQTDLFMLRPLDGTAVP